jgi:tRNA/tmRNA/rRNA uracil-C5-methylase (TrmA/RlmC/RlmD family)
MTGIPLRLVVEKIVYPGERLAHREGRAVFMDEGLPGETVEAESLKDARSHIEARAVRIIEPSPSRIEPRCGHYRACGTYQVLPYPDQVALKKDQLREILSEAAETNPEEIGFVPAPEPWRYRNRVRFRIVRAGRTASLAYRRPGSETAFVEAGACQLVSGKLSDMLEAAREIVEAANIRSVVEIEGRESRADGGLLLVLHRNSPARPGDIDPFLTGLRPRFTLRGIVASHKAGRGIRTAAEWGDEHLEETIAGRAFRFGAASFFQVNTPMLEAALEGIAAFADEGRAGRMADLYCGIGTFGIALAGRFQEVAGVESGPENIAYLKANLRANDVSHFRIHEGRSEEWADIVLEKGIDLAVVDPPRKGLDPAVVRSLRAHPPAALAYLSCNPSTLARDLRGLLDVYRVRSLRGFDFFPQTPHIETLACLVRK